jgi:type IV secretion system protein VirD4
MNSEEMSIRQKTIKIVIGLSAVTYTMGNWIATQLAAKACDYNPLLGKSFIVGTFHIYPPYDFYLWNHNEPLAQTIPQILLQQEKWIYLCVLAGLVISYLLHKGMQTQTTHGSASFATQKDIDDSGLGIYEVFKKKKKFLGIPYTKTIKKVKNSGVVVGINPFNGKFMLHNGVEHMMLMAPTRSGKGVNTIIPTGLIWLYSIFFFDLKSELWQATATYRRDVLGQKVLKFEPLSSDGSSARWNPLAEVEFRTTRELSDVSTIVSMLVKPDGEKQGGSDPFWDNAATALLNAVILHLLYSHYKEGKALPCLTDIMSFLSSPSKTTEELFKGMRDYPHITIEEFLSDHNPLQEIYGEYVKDFRAINEVLGCHVTKLNELKKVIKAHGNIDFGLDTDELPFVNSDDDEIEERNPFRILLTHPKVAEAASNIVNGAEQTRASIISTAQTCMALYQNPIVQRNTSVSDFCIRDLLDPKQAVSLYLVMEEDDIATLKPLSRLFINTLLSKLVRDMKFEKDQNAKTVKKQRLLLMLDEFPQLGCLKKMEQALAVCAGYGIKICIVSQNINQLKKEYTRDNSIGSNCHVHIYFTPNIEDGGSTAEVISKALGKKTISTTSHSDGGGGFFKGSNSVSSTGRELMTPDEVNIMSQDKELVFVAGHKPIFGDKFRYFEHELFTNKIMEAPLYSDECTKIQSYADLFSVHSLDAQDRFEKQKAVRLAKEKAIAGKGEDHEESKEQTQVPERPENNNDIVDKEDGSRPASERTRGENPVEVDTPDSSENPVEFPSETVIFPPEPQVHGREATNVIEKKTDPIMDALRKNLEKKANKNN